MSLSSRNALLSISWSLLSLVQAIVRTILWPFLFLKYWQGTTYGFWIILFSAYAMTVYISEGYTRFSINEYNLYYFQNKQKAFNYLGSGIKFLFTAYAGVIIVGVVSVNLTSFTQYFFSTVASVQGEKGLGVCLLLVISTGMFHSFSKYLIYALEPTGRIHISGIYVAIYGIVELIIGCIAAVCAYPLLTVVLCFFLILLTVSVIFVSLVLKRNRFYKEILGKGSNREGAKIFVRSLQFIGNNFFEKMALDGLNFVISFFYRSVSVLLSFTTIRTMSNLPLTSTNTIISTFGIEFQRLNIERKGNNVISLLSMIWIYAGMLINYGYLIFFPVLTLIYNMWTQGKLPLNVQFFYMVFAVSILNVYGTNIVFYLKTLNKVRPLFIVSAVRMALVFTMVALLPVNILSIGFSILITEFLVNVILLNVVLTKQLNRIGCREGLNRIMRSMVPYLITVTFLLTKDYVPVSDVYKIITILLILSIVYASILKREAGNEYITKSKNYLLKRLHII